VGIDEFDFRFDPRFRPLLLAGGVTPATARVQLTPDRLIAQFGFWRLETPLANVAGAELSGPYKWYRAIGVRLSLADRGLTFGSTTEGGVCVRFHEPVGGVLPIPGVKHPGATLTIVDRDRFINALRARGIVGP
jgi:hypothetical protein